MKKDAGKTEEKVEKTKVSKVNQSKSNTRKDTTKKTSKKSEASNLKKVETKKAGTKKADSKIKKSTTEKKKASKNALSKTKKTESKKDESKIKKATAEKEKASKNALSKTKKTKSKKDESKIKKSTAEKKKSAKSELSKAKKTVTKVSKKASDKDSSDTSIKNDLDVKEVQTSARAKKPKNNAKPMLLEYYDLPYRYNQTIVKILAQTPNTLFVYWDISDEDRNSLVSKHGDNFFYDTIPVLVIHNTTKNYSYEIEINDFANSWYIRTGDANCSYVIELGRKFKNHPQNDYIYINSSNNMVSPNDHILFENVNLSKILFKNIKTNELSYKDFSSLGLSNNMDKLYNNIYDIYDSLYDDLESINSPSSGVFYLQRKEK